MHVLAELSLKNRALIALVTIVASVFGFFGVGSLKQELMPSVQFPAVVVTASYSGASPEVVLNDVTDPIETALRGVPGLEQTTSTSSTGAAMVLAEFEYGVDLTVTEQRVERAISRISALLPQDVEPAVMSGSLDDFPVIQIAVTPPDGVDAEETARLIERIARPELSDLDGVREAQVLGARGDRVTITIDADELAEESLTSQSITDALQQSGLLMAAGSITEDGRTLAVQAGEALDSVEQIEDLPLTRDPALLQAQAEAEAAAAQQSAEQAAAGGAAIPQTEQPTTQEGSEQQSSGTPPVITIGEVAEVALEPNPEQSLSRVNGAPALTIAITKLSSANTVDVSHAVQDLLPELERSLGGAQLEVIFDQAPYVERSIETLTTEGLLGLAFAVLVILVFLLSVRATLVTAISIPVSVLLTFVALNFADYSLNMLTLGALTISIGRVVDDSIVVIENIKRHLAEAPPGADRAATIVGAVREVGGAITASTVTSAAVFLPMAFVSGMVGELFRPFAFTATFALAASLLVALTIVPVLAFWFLRDGRRTAPAGAPAEHAPPAAGEHAAPAAPARLNGFQRGYRPIIDWTLKRPAVTLLASVLVFAGTLAATPLMKTNFMGSDEQNSVGLTQTLAPGTSIDAQLEQAERVEDALAGVEDVRMVQASIGGGEGMSAMFGAGGDGVISYSITTDENAEQSEVQDEIRSAVDALDDAGEFSIGVSDGGVTMSSAIEVIVSAPDQETLAEASDALVAELRAQDGLVQVESDLAAARPYLSVTVDRVAAAEAGLSEAAVAGILSARMQPSQIGQIVLENTGTGIYLSQGEAPVDEEEIGALEIPTANGEERLEDLATIEVLDGPVSIGTQDGNRVVTVSALPEGDDLGTAGIAVDAAIAAVELPAGATASIGGVMSQQSDAFEQLGLALLIAILIVYVVMVATFKSLLQPLLLLVSVPFAATGALLLLIATGIPLGVASLIGLLMLIGIVVTNAIVLIDLVNQLRERGESLREAVMQGSLLRLRPIVMTALATILALTPMGLGITGSGGFISQPLAVVVIGGLLSSTVLTLVVLPTLYYAVERRRERSRERRAARRSEQDGRRAARRSEKAGRRAATDAASAAAPE
ncbi:efflux RND transporter permease subunit [Leucobacter weissii]|uniref:Efflux RND transporter permease subunit n=1 Tax=Leucobacter weissii TaxID=1983706 RepID=A0A939S5T2_9MICO|nr:efflux RND transporter permease subunit [Leucobacter weissii]MBO1901644.1 efflux RND transporter permease subunit [Leucobacter weissii]